MKELISELRELIDESYDSGRLKPMLYADLDVIVVKMEAEIAKEPKPKKSGKSVVLNDDGFTILTTTAF